MSELKTKAVKGVAWGTIDRLSSQGIQFVFNILIARQLLPEDYGVVAMLGIFLAVINVFIDSGFANALIRKIDRTEDDYSTVFFFNVVVSAFFCLLLWAAAPAIAAFYKQPLLVRITRIISLTLVINSFGAVHWTKLSIEIDFKSKAIISMICVFVIGVVGVVMAYKGFGVWTLVTQSMVSSVLKTVLVWVYVRWWPKFLFSWHSFKDMFSYGSKMLISALIDTLYNNIYSMVIGKFYSPASLGEYSRAESLASFPSSSASSMLGQVTFPVLSEMQNDQERLTAAYKKFLNISAYVLFPMMVGLAAVADPLVKLLLTDKWSEMIHYLQIICFALMWWPIHVINLNILQVKGRSDLFLKLEIVKKIVGVSILAITIPMGIIAMCYGNIVNSLICLWLNTRYSKDLIDFGFVDQMKNYLRILALCFSMAAVVLGIVQIMPSLWLKLCVGIVVGAAIYIGFSWILRFPEFTDLLDLIKTR